MSQDCSFSSECASIVLKSVKVRQFLRYRGWRETEESTVETPGETAGFRDLRHATGGTSQQNGSSPVRFVVDQIINGWISHYLYRKGVKRV